MADNLEDVSPIVPAVPRTPSWPPKVFVEPLDGDEEGDRVYGYTSTDTSPTISSRGSVSDLKLNEDDDVEEIVREVPPLCRLDGAHDIALSVFGCVAPKNFGMVMPGVYRSAFPQRENLSFLKRLGLKTILTLVPQPYEDWATDLVNESGIHHVRIKIQPNKDPFVVISQCDVAAALGVIMDSSNHPMLIHCNKGKHRTGTVVGCLRKVYGWHMERVCEEYRNYAGAKARVLDERYMDLFDERAMYWRLKQNALSIDPEPVKDSTILALGVPTTRLRG